MGTIEKAGDHLTPLHWRRSARRPLWPPALLQEPIGRMAPPLRSERRVSRPFCLEHAARIVRRGGGEGELLQDAADLADLVGIGRRELALAQIDAPGFESFAQSVRDGLMGTLDI